MRKMVFAHAAPVCWLNKTTRQDAHETGILFLLREEGEQIIMSGVMNMNDFDLHLHSCYSKDGEHTPSRLIEIARQSGLSLVALSDHDCMRGIDEMRKAGEHAGIQVIPAIEFTTLFDQERECHLLGYGFDYRQPYFTALPERIQKLMDDAFHQRVCKLEAHYHIRIDERQILQDAGDENPWFLMCERMFADPANAHIREFDAYRKGGARSDPAPVNFFWDKCQAGSPLYVHVDYPSFASTVEQIHAAGGIAVLAHPFQTFYEREDLLQKAIDAGIDGIEAFSNYHEERHKRYYAEFAADHGLLITCGSDFHGKHKPSIRMGEYGDDIPDAQEIRERFLAALKR